MTTPGDLRGVTEAAATAEPLVADDPVPELDASTEAALQAGIDPAERTSTRPWLKWVM